MTFPLKAPYDKVTTAYGKRGSYWSCSEDSNGNGVHTGCDLAAPSGTSIYAPCDGQIRHRSYGSAFGSHQFAISPDSNQPFGKGEIFMAHTTTRMADGVRVKTGDWIAYVGAEGNVSGPHLHMEYHADSKNVWSCLAHDNPQPVLDHQAGTANGVFVTEHVYRSKCGFGEPSNGDTFSDTVKELQYRLNLVSLEGGQNLPITGVYDAETDEEVRLWQEQVCDDIPDEPLKSYLGPNQFAVMFPEDVYILHDDGDPAVASGGGSSSTPSGMGQRFKDACTLVTATVKYESNWDSDSIAGSGPWDPSWVMLHHTAGTSSLGWICNGGDYQPVRLANFLVDRDGTLHVCAARKAYHAGKGTWPGVQIDKMNDVSVGVEVESLGQVQDLTAAQILTVSQLCDGWMQEFGIDLEKILNHKDWSTTGKTDTLYSREWWWDQILNWDRESEVPPEPPTSVSLPLGIQYWYSGKPSGSLTFSGSPKKLDVSAWAPKKDGLTFGMLYANVDGEGEFRTSVVRDPDDASAFQTHYGKGGDNYLLTHVWFESGEANRKLWYQFESMDGTSHTVTTRYAKFVTIPWEVTVVVTASVAVVTAARTGAKRLASWLGV